MNTQNYQSSLQYPLVPLTRTQRLKDWFKNVKGARVSDTLKNLNTARADLVNKPILGAGTPAISTVANIGMGAYQGINALKNLSDNANSQRDLDTLKRDILMNKNSNPMYDMYMTSEDEKLLRQLSNNTQNTSKNWSNLTDNLIKNVPSALLNAGLGFLVGNVPGAIINGVGTLTNAGIEGWGQGNAESYSKLQGLYDRLQQAEQEYRSMKRPRGLREAGLSSQYFNQLY